MECKFYEGKPCKNCGSTKKFVSGRNCVNCHYERNRTSGTDWTKIARQKNPEKYREASRIGRVKRRARMRGAYSASYDFIKLCQRYGNKCLACGRSDVALTVDHVVPLSRGGTDTEDNIQPLCFSCNASKGTKTADYRGEKGFVGWIQKKLLEP